MSKKLVGNGIWEASRLMLPEHKSAIVELRSNSKAQERPVIHEDEWTTFMECFNASLHLKVEVVVTVYDPFGNIEYSGIVTKVDQHIRQMKLQNEEEFVYINLADIVGVSMK